MANILLVDPSDVARLAMRGILERGRHRLAIVGSADEAWEFIQRTVKVDLVFSELKIDGGGLALVQRLKADTFRRLLPVVIYTAHVDREAVRRGLELRVQNFLIKPYNDEVIYAEIAKATANPWRARHFEEQNSFCKMMGFEPAALHQQLESLRGELVMQRGGFEQNAKLEADKVISAQLFALSAKAEAAGAWGVVEALANLAELVVQARWPVFIERLEVLNFADQMIFRHLNPDLEPEEFRTANEINAEHVAAARAHWASAPAEGRCPVVKPPQLFAALDALSGCPVIDSVAAAFQMSASGDPTCISPLMDLVERDPGLSVQLLVDANRVQAHADDGSAPIDDPRLAVGLLGETRLVAQSRAFVTVPEGQMRVSQHFDWPQFWSFQNGVARLARMTCRSMEFHDLEPMAYTAGLLQGLGKLLLCHLEPVGFHTVLEFARLEQVSLADAERKFLGCTSNELAVHFAQRIGLPRAYVSVMRWIDTPALATEDIELVSVVSLARDFCRHNHLGSCGDPPLKHLSTIEESPEWSILRERVFLGFSMRKFELQAHAECHEAKVALQVRGRRATAA